MLRFGGAQYHRQVAFIGPRIGEGFAGSEIVGTGIRRASIHPEHVWLSFHAFCE